MKLLEELNEPQRLAVLDFSAPLLVVAGPGSGKTRVITYKIAYILKQRPISYNRILAVTFTNKAADEMRERVARLVGRQPDRVDISTFHAFGARVLRLFRKPPLRTIFDREDQVSLLRQVLEEMDLRASRDVASRLAQKIAGAKMRMAYPSADDYLLEAGFTPEELEAYRRYQEKLTQMQAADFEDLISQTVLLLQHESRAAEQLRRTYSYILVDEFQDTNPNQYELVKLLAGRDNICVVGDEDQSIYSWRGATMENMFRFREDFPHCRVIVLNVNYRSPRSFVQAASAMISRNRRRFAKDLTAQDEREVPIYLKQSYSKEEEAEFIAQVIGEILERKELLPVAVFYRANYQSRVLEEKLSFYGIRYRVVGSVGFFERKEVKDLISFLSFAHNPLDMVSFMRAVQTAPVGIGKVTLEKLAERVRDGFTPLDACRQLASSLKGKRAESLLHFAEVLEEVRKEALAGHLRRALEVAIEGIDYFAWLEENDPSGSRRENVEELLRVAEEAEAMGMDLAAFLERAALTSPLDDRAAAPVILSTLHAAKGLEFPSVIIASVDLGFLPHHRSTGEAELEEERRLFYVGMTRAKKLLILSTSTPYPSPFLADIPSHYLQPIRSPSEIFQRRVNYVRHPVLGVGKVISQDETKVVVRMKDGSVYTFMKGYVELEPLD